MDTYYGIFITKQEAITIANSFDEFYESSLDILDILQENLMEGSNIIISYNRDEDTYVFSIILSFNQHIIKHISIQDVEDNVKKHLDEFLIMNNLTCFKGREVVFTMLNIEY